MREGQERVVGRTLHGDDHDDYDDEGEGVGWMDAGRDAGRDSGRRKIVRLKKLSECQTVCAEGKNTGRESEEGKGQEIDSRESMKELGDLACWWILPPSCFRFPYVN